MKRKDKYKNLKHKIQEIVNRHDILGLLELGAPKDEYNMETQKIIAGLKTCPNQTAVQYLIYKIFVDSFGKTSAEDIKNYETMAKDIYTSYLNSNARSKIKDV